MTNEVSAGAAMLEFARGPALTVSLVILFAGIAWRLIGIFRLPKKPDLSEPRSTALVSGALRGIVTRMWPHREFGNSPTLSTTNGYVYHIGLALIVFGYLPHIAFIGRLTGLSWPPLPEPVFYVVAGLTIVSLFIALMYRLTDPVLKLLSNFDDYFSWFVVMLALLTGMLVIDHPFRPGEPLPPPGQPGLVAAHLLAVELLFIWLPFGKLSHAFLVFVSRGTTGAAFARRGAQP
jgi:nitrate reductase gamma subunit